VHSFWPPKEKCVLDALCPMQTVGLRTQTNHSRRGWGRVGNSRLLRGLVGGKKGTLERFFETRGRVRSSGKDFGASTTRCGVQRTGNSAGESEPRRPGGGGGEWETKSRPGRGKKKHLRREGVRFEGEVGSLAVTPASEESDPLQGGQRFLGLTVGPMWHCSLRQGGKRGEEGKVSATLISTGFCSWAAW